MNSTTKVPILLLAFNRPNLVVKAMEAIKMYKPEKLYMECDGPRTDRDGETEAVAHTRQLMLDGVDWPCQVKTLFRERNMGCAEAVNDAISWFFANEEWGIICEDDVILSQDFFKLCEVLLPRYKDEEKVMEISARNEGNRKDIENTYVFSQCYHCWGWATWRRAWQKMDMTMSAVKKHSLIYYTKRLGLFRGLMMNYYFSTAYNSLPHFNSWATRWYLSILDNDGLVICPGVNLAKNIGTDSGTHYSAGGLDPYRNLSLGVIRRPLKYNDRISPDKKQTKIDSKIFMRVRLFGLLNKIIRFFHKS